MPCSLLGSTRAPIILDDGDNYNQESQHGRARRQHAIAADMNTHTVNELLDRFDREILPQLAPRTRSDYARHIVTLRQTFGSRIANQLVKADIEAFLRMPEGARGAISRNRITAVLSSVLVRAMEWGWVTHNVCSNIRRNQRKSETRVVSDQEFEGVRKLATPSLRVAMDLAMLTRQTQGNLLTLRWDQVDDHVIRFRDPKVRKKGSKKIEIEITADIRKVLDVGKPLSKNSEYVITKRLGWGWRSIYE